MLNLSMGGGGMDRTNQRRFPHLHTMPTYRRLCNRSRSVTGTAANLSANYRNFGPDAPAHYWGDKAQPVHELLKLFRKQ
jgi:hypothetical protein